MSGVWVSCRRASWEGGRVSWEVRMGHLKGLVKIVGVAVVGEGGGGSVKLGGWWLDGWWLLFVCG